MAQFLQLLFPFSIQTVKPNPKFPRTAIYVISDKIIVNNKTNFAFEIKQAAGEHYKREVEENVSKIVTEEDSIQSVAAQSSRPLWWRPGNQMLQLRLSSPSPSPSSLSSDYDREWLWSGEFSTSKDSEIYFRLRNNNSNNSAKELVYFVKIQVHIDSYSRASLTIHGENIFAPYRFENHTSHKFRIMQRGVSTGTTQVLPMESTLYAWDEPFKDKILDIEQDKLVTGCWKYLAAAYNFDEIKIVDFSNDLLRVRIISEGPTKVIQID